MNSDERAREIIAQVLMSYGAKLSSEKMLEIVRPLLTDWEREIRMDNESVIHIQELLRDEMWEMAEDPYNVAIRAALKDRATEFDKQLALLKAQQERAAGPAQAEKGSGKP